MSTEPSSLAGEPRAGDDAAPSVLRLGGRGLRLVRPVHPPGRSRRWEAEEEETGRRVDVLLLKPGEDGGPLLRRRDDPTLSGFVVERHRLGDGGEALVFDLSDATPLPEALEWVGEGEGEEGQASRRAWRFEVVLALGEAVEILHEIAGCLVLHAELASFVVRRLEGGGVEVAHRCPELLWDRSAPPRGGSRASSGLEAPEVTGLVSREIDARSDVFLLGMLAWSILTGVTPDAGTEGITAQLPLLRAFDAGVPLGLDRGLRRALGRAPQERYPTVRALLDQLRRVWGADVHRQLTRGEDRRLWVSWGSCSEIGRRKMERYPVNQDAWLEIFDPEVGWGIFAVMDGVSRCDIGRGELASWIARTTLEEGWNRKRGAPIYGRVFEGASPYPSNILQRLAEQAHDRVYRWLRLLLRDPSSPQSGRTLASTLSAVGIFRDRCAVCAVGDSPVYLVRLRRAQEESFIERVTVEQTVALAAMRRGVGPAAALAMPTAASLASALGKVHWKGEPAEPVASALVAEHCAFRLHPGDLLLLCSDGVPNAFGREPEETLLGILHERLGHLEGTLREAELTSAARALVRAADEQGGRDNLTALLVSLAKMD